jgi:hypothetical protein
MTAPFETPSPIQDYPYWPFNWMAAYGQMARDFGRYGQALSKSTDAMEAARAEADLGLRLFDDMTRAYWDLVLAPWTAMASAMARQAAASPLPMAVKSGPIKPGPIKSGPVRSGRSVGPAQG